MDVDQCVNVRRVFCRRMNKIGSLGLQKLAVAVAMTFFGVPSPSFTLLLVMVVVFPVIVVVQK